MRIVPFRQASISAIVFILLGDTGSSQRKILRVPLATGEAVAVVSYDPDRVAPEDVKRWMQLSEEGRYSVPVIQFHSDCKADEITADTRQLRAGIESTQKVIEELERTIYPAEASEIIKYLRLRQGFWLWQGERQLAWLQDGIFPGSEWAGMYFSKRCGQVLEEFRRADTYSQRCSGFS